MQHRIILFVCFFIFLSHFAWSKKIVPIGQPYAFREVKLGAVGDSYTDENHQWGYGYAFNWIQQLEKHRNVSLGVNGNYPEPRRGGTPPLGGFEFNWARFGATASTLLSQGQHTGLAHQASQGKVDQAVIYIGLNDFNPYITGQPYFNIYHGNWNLIQIQNHINNVRIDILNIINILKQTPNLSIILTLIPDFGYAPSINRNFPNPANRQLVNDIVRLFNGFLVDMARTDGLIVADIYSQQELIFVDHRNLNNNQTLMVGGTPIYIQRASATQNNVGYVADGHHQHSVLNSLAANVFAKALSIRVSYDVPVFSECEILKNAGLTLSCPTRDRPVSLSPAILKYSDFVYNFELPGDLDSDGFVGAKDQALMQSAMTRPCAGFCHQDLNGDRRVNQADMNILLNNWSR